MPSARKLARWARAVEPRRVSISSRVVAFSGVAVDFELIRGPGGRDEGPEHPIPPPISGGPPRARGWAAPRSRISPHTGLAAASAAELRASCAAGDGTLARHVVE